MKVESSALVPNRTVLCSIDKDSAGIMLLLRDVIVEDWNNAKADQYGLGILRSNAVAKMTNIKTTLN